MTLGMHEAGDTGGPTNENIEKVDSRQRKVYRCLLAFGAIAMAGFLLNAESVQDYLGQIRINMVPETYQLRNVTIITAFQVPGVQGVRGVHHLAVQQRLEGNRTSHSTYEQEAHPKVLLYITSHMSRNHFEMLKHCWPATIAQSPLLQRADVFLVATLTADHHWEAIKLFVRAIFNASKNKCRFEKLANPGYQSGALVSMKQGVKEKWFDGYDWIIRLNPDVIIRNDSFLDQKMHDKNIDGIFVNCLPRFRKAPVIHSDFTVFRPNTLGPNSFSNGTHSETQNTLEFSHVLSSGRYAWLPGVQIFRRQCRVGGQMSPVIHNHRHLDYCVKNFDTSSVLQRWNWSNISNLTVPYP